MTQDMGPYYTAICYYHNNAYVEYIQITDRAHNNNCSKLFG